MESTENGVHREWSPQRMESTENGVHREWSPQRTENSLGPNSLVLRIEDTEVSMAILIQY
nr:hypothetical protein [Saprospiraceae bacterium]